MTRFPSVLLLHALLVTLLSGPSASSLAPHAHQTGAARAPADSAASLRVMSFNLRYNNPDDGADAWPHRKDLAASMIRFHEADLVGVQEAQRGMIEDLAERLPGFDWFGLPRAGGGPSDEYSAIFYRTERLEVLEHDTFWLSETPEERGSTGWDAAFPRIATWGQFEDRVTGDRFFHFNTHFDHEGEKARAESARLLRQRSREIAGGAPTVLTGDFNAEPDALPYRLLTGSATETARHETMDAPPLQDALTVSEYGHHGPRSTWSGFEEITPGRRIDYIFVRGDVHVIQHGILTDTFADGRFPSDHLPVLAEIRIE